MTQDRDMTLAGRLQEAVELAQGVNADFPDEIDEDELEAVTAIADALQGELSDLYSKIVAEGEEAEDDD